MPDTETFKVKVVEKVRSGDATDCDCDPRLSQFAALVSKNEVLKRFQWFQTKTKLRNVFFV